MANRPHIPVLLTEVIQALEPAVGKTYIDATFGAGGYSEALLTGAKCTVHALDRDPAAVAASTVMVDTFAPRLNVHLAPFGELCSVLADTGVNQADGVVFDLGVSSMQLDDAARGFSFLQDGPLDMRMFAPCSGPGNPAPHEGGASAADVINTLPEQDLANILYEYGEERRSRAIAKAIVAQRADQPFRTTCELSDVVARVLGRRGQDAKHPATRTFQALRIYVNSELDQLRQGLAAAEQVLKPGGRLAVVSFHSLEDRIVKQFLAVRAGKRPGASRHLPAQSIKSNRPSFRILNSRPLTPSKGELDVNPRARSARLRIAERTDAPAFDA